MPIYTSRTRAFAITSCGSPCAKTWPKFMTTSRLVNRDQRVHDVLDPDDGRAGRVNFPDGLDQFGAFVLGQTAGNFVEQQKLRLDRQGAREFQAFALEQCQRARRLVGFVVEAGDFQHVAAAPVAVPLVGAAAKDRADQQVLKHGHVRERMRYLIRAADPHARARMRTVSPSCPCRRTARGLPSAPRHR